MVQQMPDWLLQQARETQTVRFDRACSILRKTRVDNGMGGKVETESIVAIADCSLGQVRTQLAKALEARGIVVKASDQAVTMHYGTEVRPTDVLSIDGVKHSVVHVSPVATLQTALVVIVRVEGK